jgi:4-hydroxy-3-methylbut-2-enyl diphosphate reductase
MIVVIPERSGFCPGVKNAEKNIIRLKKEHQSSPLYVYGFLINNKNYIEYLSGQDIHTVESLDDIPNGATVIIRTHGLDRRQEAVLRSRFHVVDLTCVNVKKVQHEIAARTAEGFFIVIVGTKNHPETKGLVSYAEHCAVLEKADELEVLFDRLVLSFGNDSPKKIFICAQTTGSRELFERVISALTTRLGSEYEIRIHDSICPVTDRKEKEALRLQREVDVSFVVGDRISSNATKLFRILSAATENKVYFIEDLDDLISLELALGLYRKALLVSSASTPLFIEKKIKAYLAAVKPDATAEMKVKI